MDLMLDKRELVSYDECPIPFPSHFLVYILVNPETTDSCLHNEWLSPLNRPIKVFISDIL